MPPLEELTTDLYALLGVSRTASSDELRAAYLRLARRHHPDVAGATSTAAFQKIAAAYGILSDQERRAAYDVRLVDANRGSWVTTGAPPPPPPAAPANLLRRVSGSWDQLVDRGVAHHASDGALEILLLPTEAETGGTIAIDARVLALCPTCFGLAQPRALWCARCGHEGVVPDDVTVHLTVPPLPPSSVTFTVPVDATGRQPPLRVRIRRP